MDIQITSHPTAKPCYEVGQLVNFSVVGVDNSGTPQTYQWLRDGVEISGATAALYDLTTTADDYGRSIQCSVSGRLSNSFLILPLEPMNKTTFSRLPAPYAYLAGGTATLAFIPSGTNMTYTVTDPTDLVVEGPLPCATGETSVYTSGISPVEGEYTITITGDGGSVSQGAEIRLFTDELVLWVGKSSFHKFGSLVSQVGYNDVGHELQFGQIERNPWLIQQFTGDTNGDVVMRLDNGNELPGAPASVEVTADGDFRAVLSWDAGAGHYASNDPSFAHHIVARNRNLYETNEESGKGTGIVLNFSAFLSETITIDVELGGAQGDYKYGASSIVSVPFGTITGTLLGGAVDEILVSEPDGQTTTEILVKLSDSTDIDGFTRMEVAVGETGQTAQLKYINYFGEDEGLPYPPGAPFNYYRGVCDTNRGFVDDIGRSFKEATGPLTFYIRLLK